MMKNAMEYSQLKNYVTRIKTNFSQSKIDDFFVATTQKLTKELYDELWVRTPVRTGFLRRGFDAWNRPELEYRGIDTYGYKSYNKKKFKLKNASKQQQFRTNFSGLEPAKDKNKYTVYIRNTVYYAGWVEFGHKQKVGRYVHAIGKRLKEEKVEGRFYMKKSVEKLQEKAPQIVSEEFNKFIRGGSK